jgi:NAD(P)-dependent dehydrogenase (short-subunit alcohol dehydrogenase family)
MATNSMQGKVCLVTGGSSGMGLVTARELAVMYELAQRLTGTGVTVNALDPGHVVSNFNNNTKGLMHLIAQVIYFFDGISPEKGAQTILYLATSPEVEGVSGKYFLDCKPIPSSKPSYDVAERQRLWSVSEARN